jgi:hypothetical protein
VQDTIHPIQVLSKDLHGNRVLGKAGAGGGFEAGKQRKEGEA